MVSFDVDDTIVAIASAPGQAIRGIVRISGPQMAACLDSLLRPDDGIAIANSAMQSIGCVSQKTDLLSFKRS